VDFWELVEVEENNIDAISAWLDAADPEDRLAATRTLSRKAQRKLFQKADSQPMSLEDLVPASRGDREQVIHHGWNTLPLPGSQRRFQKRFCRPQGETRRLFGYNEAPSRRLIGPGYFVTIETEGKLSWEERGGLVVDYFQIPDSEVVEGWPRVKANSRGLQFFAYHRTRDFIRKISSHVSIGAAYKNGKSLDHYFMLCRED
jgi:hypothetical protein